MNKKLLFLSVSLVLGLLTSCSSDDPEKQPVTPVVVEPNPIVTPVTPPTLFAEFLIVGEDLEISGTNFIIKDQQTKIFINDIEVTPKVLTGTKIVITSPAVKVGVNTVKVQLGTVSSTSLNLLAITKGWTKLTTFDTINIQTSSISDDSKNIYSLIASGQYGNYGPAKLEPKASGYEKVPMSVYGSSGDFKMYDANIGVIIGTSQIGISNDGFKTHSMISLDSEFSPIINGLVIGYQDASSCILKNQFGAQVYIANNGETVKKNESQAWSVTKRENGFASRAFLSGFGKSTSDGKFYQAGTIMDDKIYKTRKNIILQSSTGYSDWAVLDSTSNANRDLWEFKFVDINKIFSINNTDKSLMVSTDMLKTWTTLKTNVSAIFQRTETQWYIQSGNKILVTNDSGTTWEEELELPAQALVNDISFSKHKIIVSGKKGLHYLKIE